jgi:hypothetical protein
MKRRSSTIEQRPTLKRYRAGLVAVAAGLMATNAYAGNITGHITRVTYVTDHLMIMLDSGPPADCSATPFGWMMVAAANKPMAAWVTGLWMRGTASQVAISVYTSGIDSTGFCQIYQLDTNGAG